MIKKRAILLTENEEIIFRYDKNLNGNNFIELDIFKSLEDMEKAGLINLKKISNMLKARYGLNIIDDIDIYADLLKGKKDWQIIPKDEETKL